MIPTIIKNRLAQLGWTQFDLAVRAGVSLSTAIKCQRTERITVANLRKIADALGLEIRMVNKT